MQPSLSPLKYTKIGGVIRYVSLTVPESRSFLQFEVPLRSLDFKTRNEQLQGTVGSSGAADSDRTHTLLTTPFTRDIYQHLEVTVVGLHPEKGNRGQVSGWKEDNGTITLFVDFLKVGGVAKHVPFPLSQLREAK
jgi:hypothetical protein